MTEINVLMVGDVCADIGVRALQKVLPKIIKKFNVFFTVVNGENALDGEGLDEPLAKVFFDAGADVITGGNHSLKNFSLRENFLQIENVLRPGNISDVGGTGFVKLKKNNFEFEVANLLGRENMSLVDSPFALADKYFSTPLDCFRLMDFHGESTEEKEAFGFYLDGKVSVVAGTHTHVQTADEKILPNGTAYITDLGFVGAANSIIGSSPEFSLEWKEKFFSKKQRWQNYGEAIFSAVLINLDIKTKKAKKIIRILERTYV